MDVSLGFGCLADKAGGVCCGWLGGVFCCRVVSVDWCIELLCVLVVSCVFVVANMWSRF
jgi:hypothetical protein